MTYYNEEALYDDVPILEDERNKGRVQRWGTEADAEIDDQISLFVDTPLTGTIPTTISTASNDLIKSKYFRDQGELEKADAYAKSAQQNITNYIATVTGNNELTPASIVVSSSYQMIPE